MERDGGGPQAQGKASAEGLGRIDWSLLAADAAARSLDVYSTHLALSEGFHELILPKAIADHTPAMAAYSAGCVASDYLWARYLVKHHHPKLAKIVILGDASQDAIFAVHNLYLKRAEKR
jgi:hypothetical protein